MSKELISRRRFLDTTSKVTLLAAISSLMPDNPIGSPPAEVLPRNEAFPLGSSGDFEKTDWFKLDRDRILSSQLAAPFERLRVAVRMSDVLKENGSYDFTISRTMVQRAIERGKNIDLQLGAQTYGYREVNVPRFMFNRFPYLEHPGVVLDRDPEFKKVTLDYVDAVADEFFKFPEIKTIHVGNEALSEHLEVNQWRHTSVDFLIEQNEKVRKLDPLKRPLVQNLPWDTPQAAIWLLKDSDIEIMALNVYNNTSLQSLLWKWVEEMHRLSVIFGKKFAVSEYQTAPWIDEQKKLVYPYSTEEFKSGFQKLMPFPVEFFHLYDWQQLLWRTGNNEEEFHDQYSYIMNGDFSK